MTYSLKFKLEGLPAMGLNARRHWRQIRGKRGENREWYTMVAMATAGKCPPEPLRLANVCLIRRSSVEPDFEGLVGSFKPILDALTRLRIIQDDSVRVIGQPDYQWQRARPTEGMIEVTVWQAEPPHGDDCASNGVTER